MVSKKKINTCFCAMVHHTVRLELILTASKVNFRDFVVGPLLHPAEGHSNLTNQLCYSANMNMFILFSSSGNDNVYSS